MYEKIREKFQKIVRENELQSETVDCEVLARGYVDEPPDPSGEAGFTEQNFRLPSKEYALAKGEEVLVRCRFDGSYGDAFTDEPKPFRGEIEKVMDLVSGDRGDRAIFFATLNAVLNRLGLVEDPVHCEEGDPKNCGEKLADHISRSFGDAKVAHIGYQPGHLGACSERFEGYVTDLNPENIGEERFGRKILSGEENEEVIEKADVACITGSTLVNGALPRLIEWCERYDTEPIVYGVTGKGAAEILNLNGFCPLSRKEPRFRVRKTF